MGNECSAKIGVFIPQLPTDYDDFMNTFGLGISAELFCRLHAEAVNRLADFGLKDGAHCLEFELILTKRLRYGE